MTNLDHIIREATARATVTTFSTQTAALAEEMAREIMKDPAFKADMIALVRQAFRETLAALNAPLSPETK